MTSLQDLSDERACIRLLHKYCLLIDSGLASGVADLFTSDGTWSLGRTSLTGTRALRDSFAQREAATGRTTRHVLTNLQIDLAELDADGLRAASGDAYLIAYRHDADPHSAPTRPLGVTAPVMVGDLRAEFARNGGTWLIAGLRTSATFVRRDDPVGATP